MSDHSENHYRCPACERDILNRSVERCLYCGETLPEHLRFSEAENRQLEAEQQQKLDEIEEQRKRRKRTHFDGYGGPFDGGGGDC